MAAVLKHWREAATLMIIAPTRLQPTTFQSPRPMLLRSGQNQNNNNDAEDEEGDKRKIKYFDSNYETLLLKRSAKSKFMPNLYVFPGGAADNDDFSSEWISVFGKLGKDFQQSIFDKVSKGFSKASPMFTRQRDPQFASLPPEVAFRICAIRETFEESGILIVKQVKDLKQHKNALLSDQWNACSSLSTTSNDLKLNEWRQRVNENPDNFLKMCKEMDLVPDILSLYEWTNWLTPTVGGAIKKGGIRKGGTKRFDTIFYICCLDHKPNTKEDTFETVDFQWLTPSSVLSAYYRNNGVALAPPQVYELSRLLHFNKATDLMEFAADRESERVERFLPVMSICNDYIISLMPGDDLYPENPDLYSNQLIEFDMESSELNKNVKNYHRVVTKVENDIKYISPEFNIVFKNKHVGPILNARDTFVTSAKL